MQNSLLILIYSHFYIFLQKMPLETILQLKKIPPLSIAEPHKNKVNPLVHVVAFLQKILFEVL